VIGFSFLSPPTTPRNLSPGAARSSNARELSHVVEYDHVGWMGALSWGFPKLSNHNISRSFGIRGPKAHTQGPGCLAMLGPEEGQIERFEASDLRAIRIRERLAEPRGGCTRSGHGPGRFGVIARYQDHRPSPYGRRIIRYCQLLDIIPLLCGGHQVVIPAPKSRPRLRELSATSRKALSELYSIQAMDDRFPRNSSSWTKLFRGSFVDGR
jgi:hypothetical protein